MKTGRPEDVLGWLKPGQRDLPPGRAGRVHGLHRSAEGQSRRRQGRRALVVPHPRHQHVRLWLAAGRTGACHVHGLARARAIDRSGPNHASMRCRIRRSAALLAQTGVRSRHSATHRRRTRAGAAPSASPAMRRELSGRDRRRRVCVPQRAHAADRGRRGDPGGADRPRCSDRCTAALATGPAGARSPVARGDCTHTRLRLIPDGAVIQSGIGEAPGAVIAALKDHRRPARSLRHHHAGVSRARGVRRA